MSLDRFSRQRLIVNVYSETLREAVFFVSNEGLADDVRKSGGIPYTSRELREVWLKCEGHSEILRAIHAVKKHFGGQIYVGT